MLAGSGVGSPPRYPLECPKRTALGDMNPQNKSKKRKLIPYAFGVSVFKICCGLIFSQFPEHIDCNADTLCLSRGIKIRFISSRIEKKTPKHKGCKDREHENRTCLPPLSGRASLGLEIKTGERGSPPVKGERGRGTCP